MVIIKRTYKTFTLTLVTQQKRSGCAEEQQLSEKAELSLKCEGNTATNGPAEGIKEVTCNSNNWITTLKSNSKEGGASWHDFK